MTVWGSVAPDAEAIRPLLALLMLVMCAGCPAKLPQTLAASSQMSAHVSAAQDVAS